MNKIFLPAFCAFFLTVCAAMAQHDKKNEPFTYSKAWKKIEKLSKDGKNASVRTEAYNILAHAKGDNNQPQMLKAAMTIVKMNGWIEPKSDSLNMQFYRQQIKEAPEPARSILECLLAEKYEDYMDGYRYRNSSRSNTAVSDSDFQTWDSKRLKQEVLYWGNLSISNKEILQKTPVRDFTAILDTGERSAVIQPTMYDLLVHKLISIYQDDNSAGFYTGIDSLHLLSHHDFIKWQPEKQPWYDASNYNCTRLKLFHDAEAFHEANGHTEALVAWDIERMKFIIGLQDHHENIRLAIKGFDLGQNQVLTREFYTNLKQLETEYTGNAGLQAWYEEATLLTEGFRPAEKDSNPNKMALDICSDQLKRSPRYWKQRFQAMKERITGASVSAAMPQRSLPGAVIKMDVTYRNIAYVQYRIFRITAGDGKLNEDKLYKKYMALKPVKEGSFRLPLPADYEQHEISIALPGLDYGNYRVFASPLEKFTAKNTVSEVINITGLRAFYSKPGEKTDGRIYVTDAENGEGVAGAAVTVKLIQYKQQPKIWNLTTDSRGYAALPATGGEMSGDYQFEIRKGNDRLVLTDNGYFYTDRNESDEFPKTEVKLYTDRAIYRPGQTVYFKGIRIYRKAPKSNTCASAGTETQITLENENNEELGKQTLKCNEFGSFTGSFVLPAATLNGSFTLKTDFGSEEFRVEEYKRPKFEIKFNPVYRQYKTNDSVTVEGDALSYSGATLGDAKVSYTVSSGYYRNKFQIANGNVTADDAGHFKIKFKARPYKSGSYGWNAEVWDYNVEAVITDISGETHSESTEVTIGKEGLEASFEIEKNINASNPVVFMPEVKNRNRQPVKTNGTLTLYSLAEPAHPYYIQSESVDDGDDTYNDVVGNDKQQYLYKEDEYRKLFPFEPYKNEKYFSIKKEVFSKKVPSNSLTSIGADTLKNLPQGRYRLVYAVNDSFGNSISAEHDFILYQPENETAAIRQLQYAIPLSATVNQGEAIKLLTGAAVKTVFHIIGEHDGKVLFEKDIAVNNSQKLFQLPVPSSLSGSVNLMVFSTAENHEFNKSFNISILERDDDLNIKTSLFHSNLEPGQKETWKFSLKGIKAEKVTAEMMAGMYDASLDEFTSDRWLLYLDMPYTYPMTLNTLVEAGSASFSWDFGSRYSGYPQSHLDYISDEISFSRRRIRGNDLNDVVYYTSGTKKSVNFSSFRGNVALAPPLPISIDANDNYSKADSTSIGTYSNTYQWSVGPGSGKVVTKDQAPPPLQITKPKITPRKNLQELAFFMPQLKTDDNGEISISFTVPEALTRWKLRALAHTKDVQVGYLEQYAITQKQLMVQPNAPRFLTEGDEVDFSARISNITADAQQITAHIELADPDHPDKIITADIIAKDEQQDKILTIKPKENAMVQWKLMVPKGCSGFIYRITAANSKFSDGEEGMVPVLPNRILVTESMPLFVRGAETRDFKFKNVTRFRSSSSLAPYSLSMEMTANPAWYAVQALPYLAEFPHECSEQLFNRYFANSMAQYVIQKEPRIKEIFQAWKKGDARALRSNLEQDQDVKNILLSETPWVRDAENEAQRRQRIGILFDDSTMHKNMDDAITKLEKTQLADGSWPWFPGMRGNREITGMICSGIGRMEDMRLYTEYTDRLRVIGSKAFIYLDSMMKYDYDNLVKSKAKMDEGHLTHDIVMYLYARTFWKVAIEVKFERPLYFWIQQAAQHWQNMSLQDKAMLIAALKRQDEEPSARKIYNAVDEMAIHDKELGMYWKENMNGYANDIRTECMLIEAYNGMAHTNLQPVEEMKLWLLRNKQTHNWQTTVATADAVYCLLLRGKEPLAADKEVTVTMGGQTFSSKDAGAEAGTGYFNHTWKAADVKPDLGEIKVEKKDEGIAWGAVNFQYYEDIDKLKNFSGAANIRKEVFVEQHNADGTVLVPIGKKTELHTGDLVKIRLTIRTDRSMEYMHLKDMRAGALEPEDKLSGYRYQGGLGYYEDIKDASINFFFDRLDPGTYVLEYSLRVNQTGKFENGIATLENMYAPEFKSHTDAKTIVVGK